MRRRESEAITSDFSRGITTMKYLQAAFNDLLAALIGFALYSGIAWALLAGIKVGLVAAFGTSPFAANGTEILVAAVLLFLCAAAVGK